MSETALPFPSTEMDPQALAEATVQAMYPRDNASQALGMKILDIAPGRARMSMLVRSDMLNGHATCHGGFIFALADSTFAFACNSRNLNTVASGCSIEYVAPALRNDMLIAEAQERSLAGRTGVYDITVSNQDGKTIALFRGKSYRIRGEVISGLQAAQ
ncbi:hydroxyphenylacetyl-CoA thioesterase PaaI [Herbaspirillum seropedicae]|uniref:hydroxyphenylacetyl-CoA thioesterase PaaI n=1 Tax=Herbaspirillum seropedicae TaxID=964 RepID=UPI00111F1493|nr:hydroxyphenylacetyl-CoA thioesterase PaaI [Herbaspirillum seropedicae]QDD66382.1 hydroxyphenylacetyl-CoA thioesterase PaaI [Herbaspirillum seropedicae]